MIQRHNERGIFLPIMLVIIMLIAISAVLLSRFGSGTRSFIHRFEGRIRCEEAANSAINEAKLILEAKLRLPVTEWDTFFTAQMPPMAPQDTGSYAIYPELTTSNFQPEIEIGPVNIVCLGRCPHNGRAQGIFSLSVTVKLIKEKYKTLWITKIERIRFVVFRHPTRGITYLMLPFYETSEVTSHD